MFEFVPELVLTHGKPACMMQVHASGVKTGSFFVDVVLKTLNGQDVSFNARAKNN